MEQKIVEEKAEKIADVILRSEMTEEERVSWLEAIPKLNKEQLEELISTFENELKDIDLLREKTKEELKPKILEVIRDKY
ncbi:hypothetical protein COY62_01200 [bacterium (Candidatus Howlettbacteria) CG_4_10_14_0_8_um_filter_40_9]|nr:MAG: hypothetical protein COY62_01200 [bacterium (Candidatus Howlettbacteria) CG_4_10_14_0_8_um_filter_40_9]